MKINYIIKLIFFLLIKTYIILMEVINILIIFISSLFSILWAIRWKWEIEKMKVEINEENFPLNV